MWVFHDHVWNQKGELLVDMQSVSSLVKGCECEWRNYKKRRDIYQQQKKREEEEIRSLLQERKDEDRVERERKRENSKKKKVRCDPNRILFYLFI